MLAKLIELVKEYNKPLILPLTDKDPDETTLNNSRNPKYKGTDIVDLTGVEVTVGTFFIDMTNNKYVKSIKISKVVEEE